MPFSLQWFICWGESGDCTRTRFDKIEEKHWSVLTDKGLLFICLCDDYGDYSLFITCDMEECEDEDDEQCMCPACQELMRKRAASDGTVLPDDKLEESIEESRTD